MRTTSNKPIYVLGTGLSHDGSACLLKDGEICVAIEKERITRIKHDGYNDTAAIQYCLDAAGIDFSDVALVVQNANFSNFDRGNKIFHGTARVIPNSVPVTTISHHLAHAYSVVGTAPFDEMAVLVVDGCGSSLDDCTDLAHAQIPMTPADPDAKHLYFEKDSLYFFKEGMLTSIYKDFSPFGYFLKGDTMCPPTTKHSIGGLYSAVSQYVFQGMEDPGKLMGLAPYGKPDIYSHQAFELRDGRVFTNYDWMHAFDRPRVNYQDLQENFQYYADIAYWIQKEIEHALLYLVNARFERVSTRNLGYAGGVALNAVANAHILKESKFDNLYIQPAAADNGLAIGCAYYGWLEVLKKSRITHSGSCYFGKHYSADCVESALTEQQDKVIFHQSENYIETAVDLLSSGRVVAWFDGGSEFGPRALGHRSILADPRKAEIRNRINRDIKFREDFRPFAPSVLQEAAATYFECDFSSPYMILVAPTRPEWRDKLPAIVHQDGSARIQTVTEAISPNYYQLLRSFEKYSGIPILLNTSLNKRGMPIVETPAEAINFFLECALDALIINGFVVTKRNGYKNQEQPDAAQEWKKGLGDLYPENLGI